MGWSSRNLRRKLVLAMRRHEGGVDEARGVFGWKVEDDLLDELVYKKSRRHR